MPSHGKIKSQEDFKKIKEENTGIILIIDNATGNHIHTPSCSFVTEADFQEKVITNQSKNGDYFWYANITHANKTHSKVELCSVCDPDLYEKTIALNESGTFLQISVLNKIGNAGWGVEPEFPVSLAPFISDPMKHPSGTKVVQVNNLTEVFTSSNGFQQAVVGSQNQTLRKETSLDVMAGLTVDNIHFILAIQVKKLNPKYVNWCFLKENIITNELRVITKSKKKGVLDLLSILPSDIKKQSLHIQVEKFDTLKSFKPECFDYGITLAKDDKGFYKFQKSSLNEATTQCIEGTYGIIVDALVNQVTTGKGYNYDSQIFIPIIVTNANLLICRYNPKDIDFDSGTISNMALEKQDAVIYEYPFPMRVQFPNQVTGVVNILQLKHSLRWPVLILSPKGFEQFISSFNKDILHI